MKRNRQDAKTAKDLEMRSGWCSFRPARKLHFFEDDGRSMPRALCGKWSVLAPPKFMPEEYARMYPEDLCGVCLKRLTARSKN